jgi:hypothetical protein
MGMAKITDTKNVSNRKIWIAYGLQGILLISGIYQTFFGEMAIGLMTLIALALIILPGVFTGRRITVIPIEIQILLFLMVLLQLVLGEARDYYTNTNFPHYDKLVHFLLPMMLTVIAFMVVYTWYAIGKLYASKAVIMVLIVLVTLGVGAFWEIIEYSSDELIYPNVPGWHHFQGSQTEDALHDTMNDLIVDFIGGLVGAGLGVYFISKAEKKQNPRLKELVGEIADQLG